jgi:signal transduction histidine kinase
LNLITNAIDSMANQAEPRILSLRTDVQESGGVTVSVSDTGKGIAAKDIERIFNPLFTTKAHGMGMGLPICLSIIEAHDGRLLVDSNNPRGTTFKFVLQPVADG